MYKGKDCTLIHKPKLRTKVIKFSSLKFLWLSSCIALEKPHNKPSCKPQLQPLSYDQCVISKKGWEAIIVTKPYHKPPNKPQMQPLSCSISKQSQGNITATTKQFRRGHILPPPPLHMGKDFVFLSKMCKYIRY